MSEDKRIEKFAEGILYYQGDYAVSIESLKELLYLSASGKLHFDWETVKFVLKESEIKVFF
ncbi:MAG: hypothetical protein MJZ72_00110 [Bacteroidales bacterium]|nr:hypothetical protein [Bacteroidales bacterium]